MATTTTKQRVRILVDPDPFDPRAEPDCHSIRMLCWHSRYNLGDEHKYDSDDCLRELACEYDANCEDEINRLENEVYNKLWDRHRRDHDDGYQPAYDYADQLVSNKIDKLVGQAVSDGYVILPLYLYDHSGITMSTGQFSCSFDSGQVGWIVCGKEMVDKEFGGDRDRAENALQCEVADYDQYLRGDIYGFIVEELVCEDHDTWELVESCFGFYGSDPRENGMAECLNADQLALAVDAEIEYPSG